MKSVRFVIVMMLITLLLAGCSASQPTVDPNLSWAVRLSKYEIKDQLEGYQTVLQYNGTKTDEYHQEIPSDGNVFLLMKLSIDKQVVGPDAFEWDNLSIQDASGNTFQRHENDSFLEIYKYTPRMTNSTLQLGDNEGWVCFEISKEASKGQLTLVYSGENSQQQIVIKK